MFKLATDTIHNKLVITLHKNMTYDAFYDVDSKLRNISPQLSPNFTIINDISRNKDIDLFPTKIFHESLQFLKEYKVGQTIRVIGSSKIALLTFAKNTKNIDNYNVINVPTLREALQYIPRLNYYLK